MQRQAERARTSVKEEHVSSASASGRSSGKTIITVVLVVIAVLAIVAGIIYFVEGCAFAARQGRLAQPAGALAQPGQREPFSAQQRGPWWSAWYYLVAAFFVNRSNRGAEDGGRNCSDTLQAETDRARPTGPATRR